MKLKSFGILFWVLFSCKPPQTNSNTMVPAFDLEGHRGCRGLMPENTVAAMLHALQLGVNTLEMDAVITRDKEVILSHDPFFNHEISTKPDGTTFGPTEDGKYNIFKMDYAEIRNWDVGEKPHPRFPEQKRLAAVKPRLADLIDSVEEYIRTHRLKPVDYNIETKCLPATDGLFHPGPEEFTRLLMDVVMSKKISARAIIQSFDIRTLKIIHQNYPGIRTALLIEDYDKREPSAQIQELGFTPSIYSPAYQLVDAGRVSFCHRQGMTLIPWTVNDKATFDMLVRLGVDGIITDFPNSLK